MLENNRKKIYKIIHYIKKNVNAVSEKVKSTQ